MDRTLSVIADRSPLSLSGHRVRLRGKEELGLYPDLFTLECWNLSEDSFLLLSRSRCLFVMNGNSLLAFGEISDVYRRTLQDGEITTVAFAKGLSLWETPVSVSLPAGLTASETVSALLNDSGISVPAWVGEDPVFTRGQAFHDRVTLCLTSVLSAAGSRGTLIPSNPGSAFSGSSYSTMPGESSFPTVSQINSILSVIPAEGLPVSIHLTAHDLLDAPSFTSNNLMVLSTAPIGWQVGATLELEYKGYLRTGIILERSLDLDTTADSWRTELLVKCR